MSNIFASLLNACQRRPATFHGVVFHFLVGMFTVRSALSRAPQRTATSEIAPCGHPSRRPRSLSSSRVSAGPPQDEARGQDWFHGSDRLVWALAWEATSP